MKGFKPTGYGPSSGFKYPARMGFTGSTGNITQVSPYTRRLAKSYVQPQKFAEGGFVRQDSPRMKSDVIGDQGSALTKRAKPYNALDQESGGKSPLRPGYKKGGMAKKRGALMQMAGMNMPMKKTMKKADGGKIVRGSSAKSFMESLKDVPALMKSVVNSAVSDVKGKMYNRQRTVGGRSESIGEYATEAERGDRKASRYARGGKTRMGYGMGGAAGNITGIDPKKKG
jgi:hypothetical protein